MTGTSLLLGIIGSFIGAFLSIAVFHHSMSYVINDVTSISYWVGLIIGGGITLVFLIDDPPTREVVVHHET